MRLRNLGSLVILALVSSCGSAEDGGSDTDDVGLGTQRISPVVGASSPTAPSGEPTDEPHAHPHAHAYAFGPASPPSGLGSDRGMPSGTHETTTFAGFAGKRFIVFDTPERTVVFDGETDHAFGVYGHAVTTPGGQGFDLWAQVGAAFPNAVTTVATSTDGKTMLMRTSVGIQAVDLDNRGALLAGWRGEAESAFISPDGSTFAASGLDFVDVVRVEDGAHVRFAHPEVHSADTGKSSVSVGWTANGTAYWRDGDGMRFVESGSFRTLRVAMPNASVALSKDGATFVVYAAGDAGGSAAAAGTPKTPGIVEVWKLGDTKPRAHIVSAGVQQVTLDQDATHVAWAEYISSHDDGTTFLHTLDVTSGVHVRFAGVGRCSIDSEHVIGFEDGALKTDTECSPGCPSIPSQSHFVTYDIGAGKKIRAWSTEVGPSFNDGLGVEISKMERLTKHLGLERRKDEGTFALRHHPSEASVLAETGAGLRLVKDDNTAAVLTTLEHSMPFAVERLVFSPDNARVVGISGDGTLAVWTLSDGKRVWSWH